MINPDHENNKLKRDRSFLRDSDKDVNDQRASNRQLYEKQTKLQPEGQEAPAEDFNFNRFQDEPLDADSGKITRKRPQSSREKPSAQTGKAAKPASGNPRAAPGEVTKEGVTKPTPKLSFEENRKKPPSKLKHPSNIARTVNTELHRKAARANEDNNVAGEASLKAEEKVESSLKMGDHAFHAHKLRAYRKEEKRVDAANIRTLQNARNATFERFRMPGMRKIPISLHTLIHAGSKSVPSEKSTLKQRELENPLRPHMTKQREPKKQFQK